MIRIRAQVLVGLIALAALLCAGAAVAGDRIEQHAARAHGSATRAGWWAAGLVAAVAVLLAVGAALLTLWAERRERLRAARRAELRELLEVSASEAESRQLLLRHLQRLLPAAGCAVLTRVQSDARLEPTLGARIADTPLAGLAIGRRSSDSCLAIRLGRGLRGGRTGEDPGALLRCELCGRLPDDVSCEPLTVGARTLGAVLVATAEPMTPGEREQMQESVRDSAPTLALQRAQETADRRAASDPLTHLPNRRSADEALRRLSAHAGRAVSPLAVVLVDLDRFRAVNDRFGHAQGDAVITAVAQVLGTGVRASDFVARYGGEEFLVLAPDTDRQGAAELAEKLRREVEQLALPSIGRITASFGVAALPEDAVEPEQLMRRADRALYTAKALGRNRVQEAEPSIAPES